MELTRLASAGYALLHDTHMIRDAYDSRRSLIDLAQLLRLGTCHRSDRTSTSERQHETTPTGPERARASSKL